MSLQKLLWAYLILPVSLLVVVADYFLFSGSLAQRLPFSPEQVLLFSLFFVLPHIFASAHQFFDKEYVSFYRNKLLVGIPIILIATWMVPRWVGWDIYLLAFGLYTMYHVIGQQFGLVMLSLRRVEPKSGVDQGIRNSSVVQVHGYSSATQVGVDFLIWKWLGITVGFLIYAALYPSYYEGQNLSTWFIRVAQVLIPVWCFFAWRVGRQTRSRVGLVYVWANQGMIVLAILFFEMGYPFFSILVPRVVHDVTAFLFYTVHDYNRNSQGVKNKLFHLSFGRPALVPYLTGLLAIAVAMPFTIFETSHVLIAYIVYVVSTFHYFTESFAWRLNSIHRRSIFFQN